MADSLERMDERLRRLAEAGEREIEKTALGMPLAILVDMKSLRELNEAIIRWFGGIAENKKEEDRN